MMKRLQDIALSLIGLIAVAPILLPVLLGIWIQDFCSPLYISNRVGKNGRLFRMIKLRTMIPNADASGVDSTSADDNRVTLLGGLVRKYKLDELPQLWNVLKGDMSIVGPRPNVKRETDLYTTEERKILEVRPGITDFSSIVFSDEAEILRGSQDPDLAYNRKIRPWKSRLGLLYKDHQSLGLDFRLILLTLRVLINRDEVLNRVSVEVAKLGAPQDLVDVCRRRSDPPEAPPPGTDRIVESR